MAYIDVLNECVSKGLDKNLTHFYIAELWAATNKQRGNTKDFEEKIIKAVIDGELIAEASATNPKALGGYEVIPYSPTILSQFENGFIDGSNGRRVAILQLYIARDDFRAWFKKSKQWPVADDCLLAKWFEDEQQAETMGDAGTGKATDDTKAYERYKKSLDDLVTESGIDLKTLKVESIFEQAKLANKGLWNIALATFKRDVWQRYSKENDLKKQPGRPRTK